MNSVSSNPQPGYFETRFALTPEREKVWRILAREFQRWIDPQGTVIDLGAGYCNLINNLKACERHAVDVWPEFVKHAAPGVMTHVASVTDLSFLPRGHFDVAVASNLLEHLEWNELLKACDQIRTIVRPGGLVILLQPNYRYAYREYFDDYSHRSVFSHISIGDFLEANGWEVVHLAPRFLPLTMKSWLPKPAWLVKVYLWLPIKPFAKQMLVVARNIKR